MPKGLLLKRQTDSNFTSPRAKGGYAIQAFQAGCEDKPLH